MTADIEYPPRPRTVEQLFLRAHVSAQQLVDPRDHWSFYTTLCDAREAWDKAQRITPVSAIITSHNTQTYHVRLIQ